MARSYQELRAFASTDAPTRSWIEACKEEFAIEMRVSDLEKVGNARALLEDLLVCGAACLDKVSGVPIDVTTISLVVDGSGRVVKYLQQLSGRSPVFLDDRFITYLTFGKEGVYPRSPVERYLEARELVRRALNLRDALRIA